MFIVVRGRADRMHEIKAYLYGGQSIVSEPVQGMFGSFVIVESAHGMSGKMFADRVASGLFGARQFETRAEAEAYIEEEKD